MEPAREQPRAGDERSFERLYRRHRAEIYRALLRELGNREDAEDVTQAAFLDAYRALARGNAPTQPRAWLYTIAENARRRRFRVLGRRLQPTELTREPPAAASQVTVQELRDALADLPANQRAALVLREVAGLSYAEIATRLGLSVASVQMLLFRARRAVRAEFRDEAPLRRAAGLLTWPVSHWLGRLAGGHGSTGLVQAGLGAAAAGVAGAVVLAGGSAPVPVRASAPAVHAPARALAPVVDPATTADASRAPARPRARGRTSGAQAAPARPAPAVAPPGAPSPSAPAETAPAAEPTHASEPAVPEVAPPVQAGTVSLPPALELPPVEAELPPLPTLPVPVEETVTAALPPEVRSPAPLRGPLAPRLPDLPPTVQSPAPAPPAGGPGDQGGALTGFPPS